MTKVAIVCSSPLLAQGLQAAIACDPKLRIQQLESVDEPLPGPVDLVIAYVSDALIALSVHDTYAAAACLVLLGDDLRAVVSRHGSNGAAIGLLAGDASPEQLRAAVNAVLAGLNAVAPMHYLNASAVDAAAVDAAADARLDETHVDPLRRLHESNHRPADHEPLTPRELEVYELLAKGLSNRDIGAALDISAHTAKFHVGQILAKVGAATRAEAVLIGMQLGLIGA
jgi:DNA-binding NarL/FixJ family response regulator